MRKIKYKKDRKLLSNSPVYTGIHKSTESEMQLFVYNDNFLEEYTDFTISEIEKKTDPTKAYWLNIHGFNNIEILQSVADRFSIDDFMFSDILNTTRRTKIEEQTDLLFFNIKSILPSENSDNISVEQISFVLKAGILISFQEKRSDFFTHVRDRIRTHSGIIRTKKVDYLLYVLLDSIMENFYVTLESEEDKLEELINLSKTSTNTSVLEQIEKHRDIFSFLKRSIVPLRDSLYNIKNIKHDDIFNEIDKDTFSFFDRLHQKSLELLEQINYDMVTLESASNFFFSAQSNKMNEIMKTLTIISAIFIPLTFIVGVYGMNFENMPELKQQYGYHTIMFLMLIISSFLIYYFKKKKWF